jgi:hypothetical protein
MQCTSKRRKKAKVVNNTKPQGIIMTTLDIFNDIVKILNSLVLMEGSLGKTISEGKEFAAAFESGSVDEAKSKMDSFSKNLGELETLFKENTLDPAMDLYQKIKQLLHLHVAQTEKQLIELKSASGVNEAQDLLKMIDGNRKDSA